MRNIHVDEVDDIDRPVLAIGTDYPPGFVLARHRHRRAQFLYGVTGVMRVVAEDHQVTMEGVSTRSLYLEPAAVPWFPEHCRVVEVSPLLRALVSAAVDVDPRHERHGRDAALMELVLHELRGLVPLPLDLPLPRHEGLRALCEEFLEAPDVHDPLARWARALHVGERTVNRLFRAEVGMGFAQWRRRACVLRSLPPLARGERVTRVAADLGYDSPAAFSAAFSRMMGTSPRGYRAAASGAG
ncbi:AraC family transcriptional regulator [Nocardiopsis alba]|uniref:HTH-type transcriptional regulator RipA n=1 Tax=Nocardiopsis alba (strain ATCC BAA-2165 / BE74) TaxID=1205910 RepID=J7LFD1_NOCAA|nr:helix-turn-helix transcriptional regulator [Nocardiopsis alba]AFR09544.1 bacterial regulatory helix-turn-helix s, AraC family protein [Nocardiopsis alba ATCC BAA-2165]